MHRQLLAKAVERGCIRFAFKRDQNADTAHASGCRIVDVGHDAALRDRNGLGAADDLVFTNGRDIVGQNFLNRATIGIGSGQDGFRIIRTKAQRDAGLAFGAVELGLTTLDKLAALATA